MKYLKYLHCLECGMCDKLVNTQTIIHLHRELCLYVIHRSVYIDRGRYTVIWKTMHSTSVRGQCGTSEDARLEITIPGIKNLLGHHVLALSWVKKYFISLCLSFSSLCLNHISEDFQLPRVGTELFTVGISRCCYHNPQWFNPVLFLRTVCKSGNANERNTFPLDLTASRLQV